MPSPIVHKLFKYLSQGANVEKDLQDLPQKSTSQAEGQSVSPTMNSPARAAPELPSYDATIQASFRPPRNQYGRTPGVNEGKWPLVATANYSLSPQNAAPMQQTAHAPQPYGEATPQSAIPLQYQHTWESAYSQTKAAVPQQYQGRARASSNQQLPGPAFNNLPSPPPPHFYDGRNDVLGSGPYPRISNAPVKVPTGTAPLPYDGISRHTSTSQSMQPGPGQALYYGEQSHRGYQSSTSPQNDQQVSQSHLADQNRTGYQRQPTYEGQPAHYTEEILQRVDQVQPIHYGQQIPKLPEPGEQVHQIQSIHSNPQSYKNQQIHQNQPNYPTQPMYHSQAAFPSQSTHPVQEIQQGKSSNQAQPKQQGRLDGKGKLTGVEEQTRLAQQKNQGRHGFEGRHSHEARQSYESEKSYEAQPNVAGRRHSEEQHRRISSQTKELLQGPKNPQGLENRETQQGGLSTNISQNLDGEPTALNLQSRREQDTKQANQVTPEDHGRQSIERKERSTHQQAVTGPRNGPVQQSHLPIRALHNDPNYEGLHGQLSHDAQTRHLPPKAEAKKATGQTGSVTYIPKAVPHEQSKYSPPATKPSAAHSLGSEMPTMPFVASKTIAPRSTSQPPGPRSVSQPNPQPHKLHKSSQPNLLNPRQNRSPDLSPNSSPKLRGRDRNVSNSAIPTIGDVRTHGDSNRSSPYHSDVGSSDGRFGKRRSWIPGSRSRQASEDMTALMNGPPAWVVGGSDKVAYDMQPLRNAEMVPELWDDNANVFVYLYPPESRQGPSFKVSSIVISSSSILRKLAFGDSQANSRHRAKSFDGRKNLSVNDALHVNARNSNTPPHTPTMVPQDNQTPSDGSAESLDSLRDQAREGHLFYPFDFSKAGQTLEQVAQEEYDHFVSARNLLAFLTCRPLIATRNCQTVFSILSNIGSDLRRFEFSNADGSTYGEVVTTSLAFYVDNLGLADVRNSREKTLEGIVLGERLRSVELYNEAFTHAVGKYETIREFKSPVWDMITSNTRNRLERAFMDLAQRQHSVQLRLADFEIPSLFVGYAASTSTAASKVVRFKNWKSSFLALRRHVLSYYKDLYGDWPPKAKSKKNQFSISGLNRLVLKALYADFCSVYDLLVDRESLTTRSMDIEDILFDEEKNLATIAMRRILTEYDRSSPPVQPPVPFDLPKTPSMNTLNARHNELSSKSLQQAESRKLQGNETLLLLAKSHNLDSDRRTPFLQAFHSFEEKEARGRNALDLADQRYGYWLFIYVVLQALPMVVIDAPGLKFAQGIEYFLCQPPKGGIPWVEDAMAMQKTWYGVDGGSKVVALPSDIVHHSVEAIYQRSHCWIAAGKWLDAGHGPADPEEEHHSPVLATDGRVGAPFMPLVPPPAEQMDVHHHPTIQVTEGVYRPAIPSSATGQDAQGFLPQGGRRRARSASNHRKSIAFGLEQLPVPQGYNINLLLNPNGSPQISPPIGAQQQTTSYGPGFDNSGRRSSNYESGDEQGKSFDDILSAVQSDKEKREKEGGMRRKSFMGF